MLSDPFRSVKFRVGAMRSEKLICAPPRLSRVSSSKLVFYAHSVVEASSTFPGVETEQFQRSLPGCLSVGDCVRHESSKSVDSDLAGAHKSELLPEGVKRNCERKPGLEPGSVCQGLV